MNQVNGTLMPLKDKWHIPKRSGQGCLQQGKLSGREEADDAVVCRSPG